MEDDEIVNSKGKGEERAVQQEPAAGAPAETVPAMLEPAERPEKEELLVEPAVGPSAETSAAETVEPASGGEGAEPVAVLEPAQTVEPAVEEPPAQAFEPEPASPPSRPERRDPSASLGMTSERIVERVREPDDREKDQIFKDKLKVLSPLGVTARRQKKQANLDKILAHLRQRGYISNDEVEALCKVKDNTAYKYLTELEEQGLLMQLGRTGRRVRYRLTAAIP